MYWIPNSCGVDGAGAGDGHGSAMMKITALMILYVCVGQSNKAKKRNRGTAFTRKEGIGRVEKATRRNV